MTTVSNTQASLALTEYIPFNGIFPSNGGGGDGTFDLGNIGIFAGAYDPAGDLAEGQLIPISQNTALFSLLGITYGGNGTANFALPDLDGVAMIGAGTGPGLNTQILGGQTGASTEAVTPVGAGGTQTIDDYQPSLPITYTIAVDGVFPSQGGAGSPYLDTLGMIEPFAGNFVPGGYLAADGQLLQISQYTALFSILGTTYGGNGVTTFALPDLQGRDIVGASAADPVGTQVGQQTATLTNSPGQTFDNQEPSLAMEYLIATRGIFPSQGGSQNTTSPAQLPFIGQIMAFAGTFVPDGWALANGQLLSIAQNTTLFQILGTTYGGDGVTTFALPNLQGDTVIGADGASPLGSQIGANAESDPTFPYTTTETFSSPGGTDIGVGKTVTFTIAMNEPVIVTNGGNGLPTLSLNDGEFLTYSGAVGSSVSALTFSTTVQAGDSAADLQGTLNPLPIGTTIEDGSGDPAYLAGFTTINTGVEVDTATPGLSNVTTGVSYPVEGPAMTLSPNLTLSDAGSPLPLLASATVTIGGGFTGDGDMLAASTTGIAITASYNDATEVLTLSGVDTLADYQAVLRSVTLASTSTDPTNGGVDLSRTVTWQATGANGAASASQSEIVAISEVVSAGVTTNNVILYPGATQSVLSGGTASGTTVVDGSNQLIVLGGVASGGAVNGDEFIEIGGSANGMTIDGGAQVVYGTADGGTLDNGGYQYVEAGGTASGTTINSGAQIVLGAADGATVNNGGADYVYAGGVASGTNVSGGDEYVEIGGTASGTTVNGGAEVVYGTADGATLNSGGYQYIESGGAASGTTVNSTGVESIYGSTTGSIVNSGGAEYVNSGGTTSATTLSGGDEFVEVNAVATGTIVDGGTQVVYGTANGTTLNSGGAQYVEAGATASGTIVNNAGIDIVLGTAIATTDNAGGADYVYAGGVANNTQVAGGDEYVETGGATTGTTVSNGAQVVYGTATSTTLEAGGTQYVSSGGTAIGATVDGGYDYVASGGVASATTISAGAMELASGAAADSVTFIAGGGGTLQLDDSVHFGGLIAGFGQPEQLDLSDIGFGANTQVSFAESGDNASGTLTVTDGVNSANLTLLGQYVTAQFTSAGDGHGGTMIGDPPLMTMGDPGAIALANPHQA